MRLESQLQATPETAISKQDRTKSMPDLDSFPGHHQRLIRVGDAHILIVRHKDGRIEKLPVLSFIAGVLA